MANIKSAKKRAKQNVYKKQINLARKTSIKTAEKKVLKAIEEGNKDVTAIFKDAEAKIARAKNKRVLHPNTAARKISRLAKKIAAMRKKESKKTKED